MRDRSAVRLADVSRLLGVPRALASHDADDVTVEQLNSLAKNVARHIRGNHGVAQDLINRLKSYQSAGWAALSYDAAPDGKITRLWCPVIGPTERAALKRYPQLGDDVLVTDDSFHLIGRVQGANFFAWMAPIAEAGGATMPLMTMIYLSGSGIEGDKAAAMTYALKFLHETRMQLFNVPSIDGGPAASTDASSHRAPCPSPTVQFFDKDASSFLHAYEHAMSLASCEEATSTLSSVLTELTALSTGASNESIAAAMLLVSSVPGLHADGSVRPFNLVPHSPAELASLCPDAFTNAPPLSPDLISSCAAVFNPVVINAYSPIMKGIAHVVRQELEAGVKRLREASHAGDVNVASAYLQSLQYFFARNAIAADLLKRFFIHFTLLCDFHTWKAIERKLTGIDCNVRDSLINGLRDVLTNGASFADFKARFSGSVGHTTVKLDKSEMDESSIERLGFFDYIERYWLSPRWYSAVSGLFRALIEKYGINTTNDVELFW